MAVIPLHIPNGGWAYGLGGDATRENENAWLQNVWEVERWSRLISCPAEGDPPYYLVNDWTTVPFHGGVMVWSPARGEGAYLAMERWSTKICRPLHVPHKRWGFETAPRAWEEETNWRAVEAWALTIGDCCAGGGGPGG